MNRITFYLVIVLSLIFVALTLVETWMDQTWEMTLLQEKDIQLKLANAQRIHLGAQQLLRRLAIDSEHDPALLEMLKKNNIKVNIQSPTASVPAAPTMNAPPAPTTPAPSHP
jgi:hypothetical protein